MIVRAPDRSSAAQSPVARWLDTHRDLLIVAGVAVLLRLLLLVLTADTYDYDEFVILLLGRDTAHGAVPYRDFQFFHPPGILALFAILQPLTHLWWPMARLLMAAADSVTAVLVWRVAKIIFSPRRALCAGLLYALSPVALISAVRVGQDPVITMLGVIGLNTLLSGKSARYGILAGLCLAVAIWIKFPAAYFLPIYFAIAPRRVPFIVAGLSIGLVVLFAPYHYEFPQLYDQSVEFQRSRWAMPTDQRVETAALYWLLVSAPAVVGVWTRRAPAWLVLGFLLGGAFALSSQVYYHYFLVVVPFAALLGSGVIERLFKRHIRPLAAIGVVLAGLWGLVITYGGSSPLYVTAAHFSNIAPTIALLERQTQPNTPILADRFEYAFLAKRPALTHYFWNVGVRVSAESLESRISGAGAVVLSYGPSSGFPVGVEQYLDARYARFDTPVATTWLRTRRK